MMKGLLLIAAALPLLAATAAVPETATSPEGFTPRGWRVLHQVEGDLNNDGLPDAALVFNDPAEDKNLAVEIPRLLVIALQSAKGRWQRSITSETEILCRTCGGVFGDPFADLEIERGSIVIHHYGGSRFRWGFTHRYRLQDGEWLRIGESVVTEDIVEGTRREIDRNLLTGRVVETTAGAKGNREMVYHEFRPTLSPAAPAIDGKSSSGEWPPQGIEFRRSKVRAGAVLTGNSLYVWAQQLVELRRKDGRPVAPADHNIGDIFEARFDYNSLGWTDAKQELQLWIGVSKNAMDEACSLLLSPEGAHIKLR
jgi:hypothetical protein